jgi:hypothetical protein
MDAQQYQKLWNYLAIVLLFYSVNTYLSSQGAAVVLDIKLLDERRIPGAVFGFFICSTLLVVLLKVGIAYSRLSREKTWHGKIPTLFFDGLDHSQTSAKRYQLCSIIGVIVLPILALTHFVKIIVSARIFTKGGTELKAISTDNINIEILNILWSKSFRIGNSYSQGVDWAPIFQPLLMIALSTAVLAYCYLWLSNISRNN